MSPKPGRTRRRPTRQAFTVGGSGLLLLVSGSTAQAGWLFVLSAGVLGLAMGSMIVRHRLDRCEVVRSVPDRLRVGDDCRLGLTLRNIGSKRLPMVRVEESFSAFDPVAVVSEPIDAGSAAEIELVRTARRRGVFTGGQIVLTSGAPFGLTRSRRRVHVDTSVIVVPRWVELRTFPILEPSSSPSDTLHERARTGAGEEFLGVRDYRPGDPRRHVHWRSTARAGRLVVREFEEMTQNRVAVVLAAADSGQPPDSSFESLVSAAASIGIYALRTGHPLELWCWSSEGTVDRLRQPGSHALLDRLAGASPGEGESHAGTCAPLAAEAARSLGRRGTVVICTGASDQPADDVSHAVQAVQSAGSRAIVVVADEPSWGAAGAADLDGLRRRLGRAPVKVLREGVDIATCLQS